MKKIISLLLVVTLVASCGLLVGCGSKKDDAKKSTTEAVSEPKEVTANVTEKKEDASKAAVTEAKETKKEEANKKEAANKKSKKIDTSATRKPPKKPTVNGNGMVGVWEYIQDKYQIPATYTFKKDGTGNYNLAGQDKHLKWKTKGKKITITFDGQPDMVQKYTLKGDVLTLYDITDSAVVYYRIG